MTTYSRVCIPTKSINEAIFDAKGMTFHVTDVGGARSERLKWINCFNDVSAILFVASLTDYDDFRSEYSTLVGTSNPVSNTIGNSRVYIKKRRVTRMDESFFTLNLYHTYILYVCIYVYMYIYSR